MEQVSWDSKIDYLIDSRELYFNDDYIEFLISKVWKFSKPTHIVDFGCGLGFIGLKFLPLLPPGSKYTGIDRAEGLLRKAREIFSTLPYDADFILGDVEEIGLDEAGYDVAICQALLLHLSDPLSALANMIKCTKSNGKVICIEPHRNVSETSLYINGLKPDQISNPSILQKLRELDRMRSGKDCNIGIKLPTLMRELGLREIGCRINDRTNYLHSDLDVEQRTRLLHLLRLEAFGTGPSNDEEFIRSLVKRGLAEHEALEQLSIEKFLATWVLENGFDADCVYAPSMMISYGTKG